jgi:ribose transport system permease protein
MKKHNLQKADIFAALLENAVSIVLTMFVIFMIFNRRSFSSWYNITAIINDCCMYGITALGMTTVILCGEIDLSVSSIYAWSTCLFVILCNSMNVFAAAAITLATAIVWGTINGLLIAFLRMPAFVATLGSMYTIKGLAYYITEQKPINTSNEMLAAIGKWNIAEISIVPFVFLAVLGILFWFMKYTKAGRAIYATGGNYEVARLSGINVKASKIIVFIITGVCASLSGLMYCTRVYSGAATYGADLTTWCVAAAVIGGTSMSGGYGSVPRTIIGVLLMAILFNALTLLGVDGSWQRFIRGFVMVVVIMFDVISKMKKAK